MVLILIHGSRLIELIEPFAGAGAAPSALVHRQPLLHYIKPKLGIAGDHACTGTNCANSCAEQDAECVDQEPGRRT